MNQLDTFSPVLAPEAISPLCLDGRRAKRFPCHPETTCLLTVDESTTVAPVRVQNLSPGGAKLLVTQGLPGEQVRTLRLSNPVRAFSCERLVWKVYTYRCPNGIVVLGVEFAKELSQEELEELL
jgi:hypothetical protein